MSLLFFLKGLLLCLDDRYRFHLPFILMPRKTSVNKSNQLFPRKKINKRGQQIDSSINPTCPLKRKNQQNL